MPTDKRKPNRTNPAPPTSVSTLRRVVEVATINPIKAPKRGKHTTKKSHSAPRPEAAKPSTGIEHAPDNHTKTESQQTPILPTRSNNKRLLQSATKTNFKTKEFKTRSTRTQKSKQESPLDPALRAKSWCANQWLNHFACLTRHFAPRMLRGLPIFQADLFENFALRRSSVTATVKGCKTELKLKAFTENQWHSIIELLSDRAIFSTSILNGELPEGIIAVFEQCGLSLFPAKIKDVDMRCECSHYSVPCEHISALLRKIADCLDDNPLNIFLLRGKEQGELLDSLRSARSEQNHEETKPQRNQYEVPISSIDFSHFFEANDDLSEYYFQLTTSSPNTILRRLATPTAWKAESPPSLFIKPICDFAAQNFVKEGLRELKFEDEGDTSTDEFAEQSETCINNASPITPKPDLTPTTRPAREERKKQKTDTNPQSNTSNDLLSALPLELTNQFPDALAHLQSILWAIQTHGCATPRQLARRTRMKKSSISVLLQFLESKNLVQFEGIGERARYSLFAPP